MVPVLVTPPVALPVTLTDVKTHLRVDHSDDDVLINSLIQAAVVNLDGYSGILGRAILTQVWAQEWTCAGPYLLALPDVATASLVVKADGVTVAPAQIETELQTAGLLVTLDGVSADLIRIEYACGLPAHLLPVVPTIIKMMVGAWYSQEPMPDPAIDSLVAPLRRIRV